LTPLWYNSVQQELIRRMTMTTGENNTVDNRQISKPTCTVVHSRETYEGKQGLTYFAGISAESAGARGICLHLLMFPPGGRAKAHLHENHETAIYVLNGEAEMWYGEKLQEYMAVNAGDFIYIPAGIPHLPGNRSQAEPCHALVARTDPNEQESVVLLPELDERAG